MWLSEYLTSAEKQEPAAEFAQVTGKTAAQGKAEYRDLRLAAPWGIAYLPPSGADAVLMDSAEGVTCMGTLVPDKKLEQGEVLLYSAGGAQVYLKNNGQVEINGKIFAKET